MATSKPKIIAADVDIGTCMEFGLDRVQKCEQGSLPHIIDGDQ
jgi:hypothetical protein